MPTSNTLYYTIYTYVHGGWAGGGSETEFDECLWPQDWPVKWKVIGAIM